MPESHLNSSDSKHMSRPIRNVVAQYQRLLGLSTLLLMGATRNLWLPGSPETDPQIPWFSALCSVPTWLDYGLFAAVLLASLGLLTCRLESPFRFRAQWIYTISLAILVAFDQHRLQPWTLQFLIVGFIFCLSPDRIGLTCCRWIVVSIYLFSAISKFDITFFQSHGQLLLDGLVHALPIDARFWSDALRQKIAISFPIAEFLIAVLMINVTTRQIGTAASWGMHGCLLLAVGPLGLNHENGVLLWNLFFVVQNFLLFWIESEETVSSSIPVLRRQAAVLLTAIFFFLPALENWGYYDHWPAWAVYSPRPEKVEIECSYTDLESLPATLRPLLSPPGPLQTRGKFSLDQWSFSSRNCPVYPQLRYRLALAHALLDGHIKDDNLSIHIALSPNRLTGDRVEYTLTEMQELETALQNFRINTQVRKP